MNRKQFLILVVLVVVLGAAGWMLYTKNQTAWKSGGGGIGQKLLADLPLNDVAAIQMKSGASEVNLVKKDGTWRVHERGDYPANYSQLSTFLLKMADLKASQVEEVGPSQLGRYQLTPPATGSNTSQLIDFKDQGGKSLKSILLGKPHLHKAGGQADMDPMGMGGGGGGGYPDGRYVMVGTGSGKVALISDPLNEAEPRPEQWLNKEFFKVERPRAISVEFADATNSWKLTRESETTEWKLVGAATNEVPDAAKITPLASPFASTSFNDVAVLAKPEETGLEKPTAVHIETFDDLTYHIKVGAKTNENYYLTVAVSGNFPKERVAGKDEKPEDKTKLDQEFTEKQKKLTDKLAEEKAFEKWTFLVANWSVDPILKERSQLMTEKKEEPKKEDAKPEDKPPGQ